MALDRQRHVRIQHDRGRGDVRLGLYFCLRRHLPYLLSVDTSHPPPYTVSATVSSSATRGKGGPREPVQGSLGPQAGTPVTEVSAPQVTGAGARSRPRCPTCRTRGRAAPRSAGLVWSPTGAPRRCRGT